MVWEAVFMLLILKIPVVYLALVVWWAIRAKPEPPPYEPALRTATLEPSPGVPSWRRAPIRSTPRGGPHGSPGRTYARRGAVARAERR